MWFSPWRRILRGKSGDTKPSGLRAGTKFVEEDTGIEYTYDPVMQDWKKKVSPYSAIVCKDGSTVWAEDSDGKTIASGEAGVDDASVIQSALNQGGRVFINPGEYIGDSVTVNCAVLVGAGSRDQDPTSTILKMKVVVTKSNTVVSNLLMKGQQLRAEGPISDIYIENVHIVDAPGDAFYLEDVYGAKLLNCKAWGAAGRGFNILGCNGLTLFGCIADHCKLGFRFTRSDASGPGASMYGVSVINCLAMMSQRYGLYAEGVRNLHITNGTRFDDNSKEGGGLYDDIILTEDANGNPCRNVEIKAHIMSPETRHLINCAAVDHGIIECVHLSGGKTTGIRLTGSANNIEVRNPKLDYITAPTKIYNDGNNFIKFTGIYSSPPLTVKGVLYLDNGSNTGDGAPHWRYYDGSTWHDL